MSTPDPTASRPAGSIDGADLVWTRVTLDGLSAQNIAGIDRVIALGDRFVAFGYSGSDPEELDPSAFLVSDDGLTWDLAAAPPDLIVQTATVVDGEAWVIGHTRVAVDPERQLWRSRDGQTWRREDAFAGLDGKPGSIHELIHSDDGWLAWGDWQPDPENMGWEDLLFVSDDGIAWEERPAPVLPQFTWVRAVGAADGATLLVTVGEDDQERPVASVLRSEDGHRWGPVPLTDQRIENVHSLCRAEAGWVVAGSLSDGGFSRPAAWFSTDGLSWEPATFQSPGDAEAGVRDVIGVGDGFMATGSFGGGAPTAWWSVDGRSWDPLTGLPVHLGPSYDGLSAAAAGNDRVVLAGQTVTGSGAAAPVILLGRMP